MEGSSCLPVGCLQRASPVAKSPQTSVPEGLNEREVVPYPTLEYVEARAGAILVYPCSPDGVMGVQATPTIYLGLSWVRTLHNKTCLLQQSIIAVAPQKTRQ